MKPIELYNMYINGKSLSELGSLTGLSKQRIGQLLKPYRQGNDLRLDRPAKEYIQINHSWLHKKQSNIFYTRRKQAQIKGIEWSLKPNELIWPEICPILGLTLDYTIGNGRKENSPSLDRIDCTKGYTADNVRIISWRANRIKNDGTAEEHQKIFAYMTSFFGSQV